MKHPPQISGAEWQVMEALWRKKRLTANEVIVALGDCTGWKPNTVRTLLARLVKKGALKVAVEGNRYIYTPRFPREQHVSGESESFLSRIFGGTARGFWSTSSRAGG